MKNKIFIIAEAGVNHNGQLSLAKKLVQQAKHTGADAVKFQTFKTENLALRKSSKADYQRKNTSKKESQFKMLKKLELSYNEFKILSEYCRKTGIVFLSSAFDLESIDFLSSLKLSIYKIPSGEITNYPYLRKIGSLNKKVVLSTGMANMKEIDQALKVLISYGTKKKNITLLHCHTEYPTSYKDVNLKAMLNLKKRFKIEIGYSDHTQGIEIPIAASALGAKVIEKHFTLDRNMSGPDHKASLEVNELMSMVQAIRHVEQALGSKEKTPSVSEKKNMKIVRKSIIASCFIAKGEVFTENNLSVKRPGTGITPMQWNRVLGKKAKKNFSQDEIIVL